MIICQKYQNIYTCISHSFNSGIVWQVQLYHLPIFLFKTQRRLCLPVVDDSSLLFEEVLLLFFADTNVPVYIDVKR